MKLETIIFGVFASAQSILTVLYFSPNPGSVWGNTFFGIPYSLAVWVVPVICGILAVLVSHHLLRRDSWKKQRIRLGLAVATLCFLAYAFLHVLLAAFVGRSESPSLLLAILLFGGLFILPVSMAFSIVASVLGSRLSALTMGYKGRSASLRAPEP